jgi:guanine deaminase
LPDQTPTLLRGRLLDFSACPAGADDTLAYSYEEDGALLLVDGKIAAKGLYREIVSAFPDSNARIVDHRPHLILPGFIDTHIHFPQAQVIASWADQLLDWLNDYTFPAEMKFADKTHADRIAAAFFDALVAHGTTTAVAYCSSHPASVDAYFEEAERRGMLMLGGKTMMDRNAPAALCDTAESAYDDSKALLESWHGRGRAHYVITPRFAITSTPAQLEAAGTLLREFPDCHLQTHINENHNEIALTGELYPDAAHYLGVYESFGLLGPKTLLGHCIHMTGPEMKVMRETGSVAVFCPTSNLFLGSGLYDKSGLEGAGIRTAIATDVGGGTSYSMLRTPGRRLQGASAPASAHASPDRILLGNARKRSGPVVVRPDRNAAAGQRRGCRRSRFQGDAIDGAAHGDRRNSFRGAVRASDPRR